MADTICRIIRAAVALPLEEQGHFIASQAIAMTRAADAAISDQALEAEFRAWWAQSFPAAPPNAQAVANAVAWGRHLLSRGAR